MKSRNFAITAVALAALAAGAAQAAESMKQDSGKAAEQEKCYGVSMAGKNDCASGIPAEQQNGISTSKRMSFSSLR